MRDSHLLYFFLILLNSIISPFTVFCQTISINGGGTHSTLDYVLKDGYGWTVKRYSEPLNSYFFSAGIEYLEQKNFSLTSELSIYKSGGQYSEEEMQHLINPQETISADYMSIGTSVNLNPLNRVVKIQFQFGPRIDFLAAYKDYKYYYEKSSLSTVNFGVTSGVGLFFNIKQFVVGANAKYLTRFRKLIELEPDGGVYGVTATEQTYLYGLSLGYKIKSKKDKQQ